MKLPKAISFLPLAFGSIFSVSAQEYKFDNTKFDQVENIQNTYQPKDKLDEYIINGATYSTKFVPLMNDGAEGSEYTGILIITRPNYILCNLSAKALLRLQLE